MSVDVMAGPALRARLARIHYRGRWVNKFGVYEIYDGSSQAATVGSLGRTIASIASDAQVVTRPAGVCPGQKRCREARKTPDAAEACAQTSEGKNE